MSTEHLAAGVLDTDPRWIGAPRAACRDHDPELWFPVNDGHNGSGSRIYHQIQAAKQICGTCAIRDLCRDSAIAAGIPFGVWGGMTPTERAQYDGGRRPQHRPWQRRNLDQPRNVALMARLGRSDTEIGAELGISIHTVRSIRRRHGIPAGAKQGRPTLLGAST